MPDPFISRADLGEYLGQDLSTSDKALICVDAACDIVRTLAEQTFNEVTDDEIVLDGTGTDALLLPERPVIDITTVTEGETVLNDNEDYKLNGNGVLLRVSSVTDDGETICREWPQGRQNIAVKYSHGYDDPDLPRDVRMVALSLAARLFQQQPGVVFESLGARSIRWEKAASELTNTEMLVLRKYQ